MTDIPALLARIPDGFKPLAAIGIGAVILVVIVLFHGSGLHCMLVLRQRRERRLRLGRPYIFAALLLFGWSVFFMLALHIAEFAIWAYSLLFMGLITHANDALYFCANAYTTLGYGAVDLGLHWRNLSPIVGISGLFTMAWTSSALVGVVSSHRQLLEGIEHEREIEIRMRVALGKEEWEALKEEREQERSRRRNPAFRLTGPHGSSRAEFGKTNGRAMRNSAERCGRRLRNFGGKSAKKKRNWDQGRPRRTLRTKSHNKVVSLLTPSSDRQ